MLTLKLVVILVLTYQPIFCLISTIRNKDNPPIFTTLPYYTPKTCGELTFPEEIDQEETHLGDHPWVVGIVFWFPGLKTSKIDCAGVLISEWWVLTAGECVLEDEISIPKYVRVGEWNTSSLRDCENFICQNANSQDIPIAKSFTNYDPDWIWNDNVALIKLWINQHPSRYVAHICLPNVEMHNYIKSYVGSSFVVSGWSRKKDSNRNLKTVKCWPGCVVFCFSTDTLSEIKLKRVVTIDPDDICENYFFYRHKFEPLTHFCSNTTKTCVGDGPVMGIDTTDPDNPYWYIFGIFSYVQDCKTAPRMFTKIMPYMKWIQDTMLL